MQCTLRNCEYWTNPFQYMSWNRYVITELFFLFYSILELSINMPLIDGFQLVAVGMYVWRAKKYTFKNKTIQRLCNFVAKHQFLTVTFRQTES